MDNRNNDIEQPLVNDVADERVRFNPQTEARLAYEKAQMKVYKYCSSFCVWFARLLVFF